MRSKWLKSKALLFLTYRLSSVFLVQTSYVPDEYWQSLEVAHKMVFGYGHLTWEWKHGLRSYAYPSVFAIFYQILKYLQLDTPTALIVIPRIAQAFLTAVSDVFFFNFCKTMGCRDYWIKTFIFTNWFWYFCGSRTILNMFETSLTIIALYHFPWNIMNISFANQQSSVHWSSVRTQSWKYLVIVALNCYIRPTAVTIWAPLVLCQLYWLYPSKIKAFILTVAAPIAIILFVLLTSIDQFCYEKFVFPPYNFFMSNIYSNIASFYGSHPHHWYLSQGIPVVLGLHIFPFFCGIYKILQKSRKQKLDKIEKLCIILLAVIIINIFIFSSIPHKEFRFILPLLPMMELIAIRFISMSRLFNSGEKYSAILKVALMIGFIIPAGLFGLFHQKGTITVMNYLSKSAANHPNTTSLLFLTPCHATPTYSHLHVNVPIRFLTCDPPISADYYDESEQFFNGPLTWLENNWPKLDKPSHVILFDTIQSAIDDFLQERGLAPKEKFLHTVLTGSSSGDYILVYERE